MKRKVVKQGAATLMVSLPSKWARENHLNKGSEVDIEVVNENLIISSNEIDTKLETEIKLDTDVETSVRTLITNAYRKGYDKITVYFENENQFEILSKTIKTRLIGFDIINKEANVCVVENITEPSEDQFDNILSKVFLSIDSLFEVTENRMNGKKVEENFEDIEERFMKYDNFCRRIISKRKLTMGKAEFFWAFLHLVDHGQRELYHMNKGLKNVKVSEKTKELFKGCREMFTLVRKAYYEKSLEIVSKIHLLDKELIYKKGYKALELSKGKESIILYHLIASIRKFFQTNSPLSGLIL